MRLGLALGGGGAKGLAHVVVLEAFDELGLRPAALSGSSVGAIFAALYASGRSASEIRALIDRMLAVDANKRQRVFSPREILKLFELIDPEFGRGGLIKGEKFLAVLLQSMRVQSFEELEIPLKLVATDFWRREACVFERGPLKPAIRASMALPGLFTPLKAEGRVLIDGGAVNPVPYDVFGGLCDEVVAVDVSGRRAGSHIPGVMDTLFNTYQIMQSSILAEKLRTNPPAIFVKPEISDVRVLEFHKAHEIYRQAQPAKERLKADLEALLEHRPLPALDQP